MVPPGAPEGKLSYDVNFQKSGGPRSAKARSASRASSFLRRSSNIGLSSSIRAKSAATSRISLFVETTDPAGFWASVLAPARAAVSTSPYGSILLARPRATASAPEMLRQARTEQRRERGRCSLVDAGWAASGTRPRLTKGADNFAVSAESLIGSAPQWVIGVPPEC